MKIDPKHISTLMATDAETTAGLADKVDKITGKGLSTNDYTTVEQTKLSTIAEGATANSTDAILLNRSNHTGTQLSSTISDLPGVIRDTVLTGLSLATNSVITITDSIVIAFGKIQTQITDHLLNFSNPHSVTQAQVGLSNADNTSDINKPISTATQTALNLKYDASNPNSYETSTELNARDILNRVRANHTGDETELTFSEGITPSIPVLGLKTFARQITGRNMFGQIGKSGVDYSFQPLIARNKVTLWQSNGNATSVTVIGNAITAAGTATTRAVATTNKFTWFRRIGYASAATANSSCGIRTAAIQYGLGNVPEMGGFHFITRCGISDAAAVANARMFVGLTSTTAAIGNVNPSTLVNIIGFGADTGDTTLQVMHNTSVGVATKIDLGASFPANTRSTDMYEFSLYCQPNGSTVNYQVINLTTGNIANGVISTNLPLNTQLLAMQLWRHNGGTASAVALDIVSMYIETDN